MALEGGLLRWMYSNAVDGSTAQDDPTISLGGRNPDDTLASSSAPYRQALTDSVSPAPNQVQDTQVDDDSPGTVDPEVGDWLTTTTGLGYGQYGKVTAVNYVTGVVTIDRPLTPAMGSGERFRTSKRENLFPDVELADLNAGFTDYRMLYFLKDNTGENDNFRWYVDPIKPNGCDISIFPGAGDEQNMTVPTIPDGRTSPFVERFGQVANRDDVSVSNDNFAKAPFLQKAYGRGAAIPPTGSNDYGNNDLSPIWIARTVPPSAQPGECVFGLFVTVPDAETQDATADPGDPFFSGFIFHWNIPATTYTLTITQDRTIYNRGAGRLIGTVTDSSGNPVVGVNAWMVIDSGPGSIDSSVDGVTDANGQITAVYTAPDTISTDPVIRLIVPTNPGF